MASWNENSSYQGAASGAAVGTVAGGPGVGTAIGAGIGFIAGGILGGMASDSARKAEEERRKEIERAIERQNRAEFGAKAAAEAWALADIGINKEDQYLDAIANRAGLAANEARNNANVAKLENKLGKVQGSGDILNKIMANKYQKKLGDATWNKVLAQNASYVNDGIIASYEDSEKVAPTKY